MADLKITGLGAAAALDGSELVEAVQGGVNVQTTTQDIADLGGGGGSWGSITGTLSSQTDLQTALDAKLAHTNAAVALTDAASMDLTSRKHTLTTSSATRTFTISYGGDKILIEVTLNAVDAIYTFPATALCVTEGIATGDNTMEIQGVSGDRYLIEIEEIDSNYYVTSKRFGQ